MTSVAIGSDHAGYWLKGLICTELRRRGLDVVDCGTGSDASTDYPPFCFAVGEAVAKGEVDWGIVLGGSGQGEQMAANKVPGVRAALCNDPLFARLARRDNDANVLSIGARIVAPEFAVEIIDAWLASSYAGGRHARRLKLIAEYERTRGS